MCRKGLMLSSPWLYKQRPKAKIPVHNKARKNSFHFRYTGTAGIRRKHFNKYNCQACEKRTHYYVYEKEDHLTKKVVRVAIPHPRCAVVAVDSLIDICESAVQNWLITQFIERLQYIQHTNNRPLYDVVTADSPCLHLTKSILLSL